MSGETGLDTLLAGMKPVLHWDTFVFVTTQRDISHLSIRPRMQFREEEGLTLIITKTEAEEHGFPYTFPSRMITLSIHSSLDAVGFMARIAGLLAEEGIAINPISAFYHDHIFVAEDRAENALHLLETLTGS